MSIRDPPRDSNQISCKWGDCSAHFGSQLDLGLHVLANHLELLDYGHFVLTKKNETIAKKMEPPAKKIKLPEENTGKAVAVSPRIGISGPANEEFTNTTEYRQSMIEMGIRCSRTLHFLPMKRGASLQDPNKRLSLQINQEKARPIFRFSQNGNSPKADTNRADLNSNIQPSTPTEILIQIIERIRYELAIYPNSFTNYQHPENFCVICLKSSKDGRCRKPHSPIERKIEEDWKKKFKPSSVNRLVLLKQLKMILEEYSGIPPEPIFVEPKTEPL